MADKHLINPRIPDGRKAAIRLLKDMRHAGYPLENQYEVRNRLKVGLINYQRLEPSEQERFIRVMADYIGSCLGGCVPDPETYERRPRFESQTLNPRGDRTHLAEGVRHD